MTLNVPRRSPSHRPRPPASTKNWPTITHHWTNDHVCGPTRNLYLGGWQYLKERKWNEMDGVLGQICAHICLTGPGEPPEDGEIKENRIWFYFPWWDEWDDTALQTQDSKFEPCRSEAEHATSRSWRLPTILYLNEWAGKKHFVSLKLEDKQLTNAGVQWANIKQALFQCIVLSSKYQISGRCWLNFIAGPALQKLAQQ